VEIFKWYSERKRKYGLVGWYDGFYKEV
jgi:hypothetical protein